MKKIIALAIALMALAPVMDAQIQKTDSFSTKVVTSVRTGFVKLMHSNDYFLAMNTTNQFDDAVLIKLGNDKETAIQTLNDLIGILESLKGNDMQYIKNGYNEELCLYKIGTALCAKQKGNAGYANVGKGELQKFIKALEKE